MNSVSRSLVRILVIATGEQELTPREENTAAWALMIGLAPCAVENVDIKFHQ